MEMKTGMWKLEGKSRKKRKHAQEVLYYDTTFHHDPLSCFYIMDGHVTAKLS